MATLLSSHLDQISLCATSIAELSFPKPAIFSNALLSARDITLLIRDTEQHERALFHLAPPPIPTKPEGLDYALPNALQSASAPANRRKTIHGSRQPQSRAVAAVLGGDMYRRTRNTETGDRNKGDLDVDVLLEGAEKLAAIYPMSGAFEKITSLRRRHQQLIGNISHFEARVQRQTLELQQMNRPSSRSEHVDNDNDDDLEGIDDEMRSDQRSSIKLATKADIAMEEKEIQELEQRKRDLEDRVKGMERDLGGLLR